MSHKTGIARQRACRQLLKNAQPLFARHPISAKVHAHHAPQMRIMQQVERTIPKYMGNHHAPTQHQQCQGDTSSRTAATGPHPLHHSNDVAQLGDEVVLRYG